VEARVHPSPAIEWKSNGVRYTVQLNLHTGDEQKARDLDDRVGTGIAFGWPAIEGLPNFITRVVPQGLTQGALQNAAPGRGASDEQDAFFQRYVRSGQCALPLGTPRTHMSLYNGTMH
jgi:hypothetical protein